jgi:DNA-binding transcriptional LysR family regulator
MAGQPRGLAVAEVARLIRRRNVRTQERARLRVASEVTDVREAVVGSVRALDLRRLQTLQRVAARGSFSRAADELHFTQSAVSQQVAALERDVGVRLLNRNPVSLTEPGRMLCDRYVSAIAELAAAEAELESFRAGGSGRVRLATVGTAGTRIVPRATVAFAARFPTVAVHATVRDGAEALASIRRGDADIALVSFVDEPPERVTGVRWIRLARKRIAVAIPGHHPLARQGGVRLTDLAAERYIHSADTGVPTGTLIRALGAPFAPRVVVSGESREAVTEMVAAGAGIALVAAADAREELGVAVVPLLDPPLTMSIYAAALDAARLSAPVAAMLEELVLASCKSSRHRMAP